ncbi:serine/threonine-protein kinase [Streptomyces sp. NPDC050674]|uniref:serine/threonine-protein kinase n=1 Tax=Streptomyces sp. NPDC050674 TaxID=3157216 RepID=UPI00341C1B51
MGLREERGAWIRRGNARILAGRYRLDALIGSGGAADVYRGHDLRLRRPVAVKLFRAGTGFDTEDALRGEAVILARLQHPGLVTAFDAGRHDGEAFLVMQLIEGHTLKSRIAEGPLSCEAAAALGAELAEALAHAHEAGIVHRDVKPSNILLDRSGHPHLTDFGISRLLDATTRTATGTLTGTAAYLSPEQVLGRSVGRPADIYALGLVLLESLTGRLEYDGGPLESAIARLHRPPDLPDFLPDAFATLLRDMTGLDEQARPGASDCAQALARLAGTTTAHPAASFPRAVLSAVPHTAEDPTDSTHRSVSLAANAPDASNSSTGSLQGTSRAASPRRRPGARGAAAAALAALVAGGLILTDGFSHHDATGEAAPSASDPSAPSAAPDTAAHDDDTPSASASAPSRSPSASVRTLTDPATTPHAWPSMEKAGPADRPDSPPGTSEQRAAKAAVKDRADAPVQPPGQERKHRKGMKKAAHAK